MLMTRECMPPHRRSPAIGALSAGILLVINENIMSKSHIGNPLTTARAAAGLSAIVILSACASAPPAPTEDLVAARSAISSAETSEAGRYSAPEIGEARDKLAAANAAVEKKDMVDAQRLAQEARVEADLASAKTAQVKATSVNDQLQHDNDALVGELQRNSGSQP
jgi:hypothetical protein